MKEYKHKQLKTLQNICLIVLCKRNAITELLFPPESRGWQEEGKWLPLWRMGATSGGAGRRAFLVLNNQLIDNVSAVHATASHSHERLTGSTQVNEFFSYQVPSAPDAGIPLTDHAPFGI